MKNFLFDLYGTLADIRTDEYSDRFWKGVGKILGCNAGEVKRRYAELCAEQPLPDGGEIDLLKVMQQLVKEYGSDLSAEEFALKFRGLSLKKLRLYGGVNAMLEGLRKRGAKLYILSNAQACFTRAELQKLSLADKVDGVILSSETGWKKPSANFFGEAFEKFSLVPGECLYIGNDLHDDVSGAHNAGMKCVYIHTGLSGKYDEPTLPDYIAANHKKLAELLLRLAE